MARQLKCYAGDLACRTREQPVNECRTSVNRRHVFLSLKTGSVKFLRLSNVDKIVSGLSEVDRGFMFCESFLGVRSSEKDDPCNKPSL